jgi:UDP-N-acetylmuramate--alanine ligase
LYGARQLTPNPLGGFTFDIYVGKERMVSEVALRVPGMHNVRNALAALGSAHQLGLSLQQAALALSEFRGTGRRFELRGEFGGVTLVDDYAHHPTEIRATLSAARARFPARRIWAVWQPHTYSRTRTLFDEFAAAFGDADFVVVTEIYAARESAPSDGFSAQRVVDAILAAGQPRPHRVNFVPDLVQAHDFLLSQVQPDDVVLVLSAGDADQINIRLAHSLARGNVAQPVALGGE